ncbi:winged helix-turn-helix domain-containing protein [Aliiglaciecola sp. M165]|uniref:winged helix-turn-helix domain-containing protein n=1 Tax=Aliiglaciecola sp. M165 TaxID=2593649 RepID=UPI00163DCEF8|nr:winged helix-turn-helix domain-containing protein [Aliiglaciecola sp. M165]
MENSYQFDNWIFKPDTGALISGEKETSLEPKVARLLEYLILNQNRVITREELIEKVWENRIVSSDPINRCISIIRQTLNPEDKSAYIETVPKKGYLSHFTVVSADELKTGFTITRTNLAVVSVVILLVFVFTFQWVKDPSPDYTTPSIAVLPFSDLSETKSNQFLAQGMSDTVIDMLSRVKGLDVTARTSSFAIANQNLTVSQIASQLGIEHMLEGSIQVNGNDIRVLTRLINANTQKEIWSQSFDRQLQNVFSVQDDIAAAVVAALKGTILPSNYNNYEPSFEVYELVLKGRVEMNKMTSTGLETAQDLFRQAIRLDSQYPLPHILLAKVLKAQFDTDSYTHDYQTERKLQFLDEVEHLLDTALKLDPNSGEARNLNASMLIAKGKTQQAGIELERAIELEPNNADAIGQYATWLQFQNRLDEAVIQARKAASLDPTSSKIQQILAQNLWISGRSEEAISIIEADIVNNPTSAKNNGLLARWSLQLGRPGKAMLYAIKEKELDPNNPDRIWGVCLIHYQLWDRAKAQQCTQALLAKFPNYYEAKKWSFQFGEKPNIEDGIDFIYKQIELFPRVVYFRLQAAHWLVFENRPEEALTLLEPNFPELFANEPTVTDWSLWAVDLISQAWTQLSEDEKATTLLKAGLAHIAKTRKLQGGGFSSGIEDVRFHILLGEHSQAMAKLKMAIDNHWSMYSMWFHKHPVFEPFVQDPQFLSLVEQHKAFMQSQRQWYQRQLKNDAALSVD